MSTETRYRFVADDYCRVKEGIRARVRCLVKTPESAPVPRGADEATDSEPTPAESVAHEDVLLLGKASHRRRFIDALRAQCAEVFTDVSDSMLHRQLMELEQQGEMALEVACTVRVPESQRIDDKYLLADGRFYQIKQLPDGIEYVKLTNYMAMITQQLIVDDGAERSTVVELEGRRDDGAPLPVIRVPKTDLDSMSGVLKGWDARVIHAPGPLVKDRVRYCIQTFSAAHGYPTRVVYGHTGWRRIGETWAYLHAGGALGAGDVTTDIDPALGNYDLPAQPDQLVEAVKASLALQKVASPRVTLPLLTTVYLAPLAEWLKPDFTCHLEGRSGVLKSTLCALFVSHFGPFERTHPPGHWVHDTANALGKLAFLAKDTVFWIDDLAPSHSQTETRERTTKFLTVIRAQGDRKGRRRMRVDTSLRPDYSPRGVILSSGEFTPGGTSDLARLVALRLQPDDIHMDVLAQSQDQLALLSQAMTGYIQWIQAHLDSLPEELRSTWRTIRAQAMRTAPQHMRQPEIVAHWSTALTVFLSFAQEIGAIEPAEAEQLLKEAKTILADVVKEHGQTIVGADPIQKFLNVLGELLIQKRIYLKAKDGSIPEDAEAYGWIVSANDEEPYQDIRAADGAKQLGWVDDTWLYLLPEDTYKTVE